jgi:2,3-bisphosphoglycerate-independent phosphoglycerate mutase
VPHVFVHFFGDGRDTAPKSAVGYAKDLQAFIKELNGDDKENKTSIKIATVAGRYYAMDRDKRWERVSTAVAGLVDGEGEAHDEEELVKAIEARYEKNETDEFLKPIILGGDEGRIKGKYSTPQLLILQSSTC